MEFSSLRSHRFWSSESIRLSADHYHWKYWCSSEYGAVHVVAQCLGNDGHLRGCRGHFLRHGLSSVRWTSFLPSIHWHLCVVCIDPWWWFPSISRRNERLLTVGEFSSLFRQWRPSSDRDCHRWYGHWRAVIRTAGWLSDEELRLESRHVRLCWSDALMHSLRSHYETIGTEEGSDQTSSRR